jgi:thioredoxin 1
MKKLTIALLLLVSCSLFCSQINGEQASELKIQQKAENEENLIITDEQLDFSKHKVTFIELGADKCIPCKAMQPVMREIAQEYEKLWHTNDSNSGLHRQERRRDISACGILS